MECAQTELLKVYVKSKNVPLSLYKKEKNLIDFMKELRETVTLWSA